MDLLPQLESDCMNPEQALLESERKTVVEQAMSRLRPRIRAALELAQPKELSMNETARALGISLPAAKARVFHARKALRRSPALRAVIQQ